jgi:hypothetical protein
MDRYGISHSIARVAGHAKIGCCFRAGVLQLFLRSCYLRRNAFPPATKEPAMRVRQLNRNKLHAALCITSSAVVSIVVIWKAIQWLF